MEKEILLRWDAIFLSYIIDAQVSCVIVVILIALAWKVLIIWPVQLPGFSHSNQSNSPNNFWWWVLVLPPV